MNPEDIKKGRELLAEAISSPPTILAGVVSPQHDEWVDWLRSHAEELLDAAEWKQAHQAAAKGTASALQDAGAMWVKFQNLYQAEKELREAMAGELDKVFAANNQLRAEVERLREVEQAARVIVEDWREAGEPSLGPILLGTREFFALQAALDRAQKLEGK